MSPHLPETIRQRALSESKTIGEYKVKLREALADHYGSAFVVSGGRPILNPMIAKPPTTEREVMQQRNAMVQGNYPVGIDDCHVVGISSGCGGSCPVLRRGECPTQDEMQGELDAAQNTGPECRVCNHPTTHRQDADDTWICADCEEIER